MKRLFKLQFIGITFIIYLYIITATTIINDDLIKIFAEESMSVSQNNSSLQPLDTHNMTQMMQRGNVAMGFDQNKISHEFISTEYGGQIKITALDKNDNQTISQIKSHILDIQNDFAKGNFTKPFYIHAQSVPGTDAMSLNKDQIRYQIQDLETGSIMFLITNNSNLANSINQFMTFLSTEHRGH